MYLGMSGNTDLTHAYTRTQADVSSLLLSAICVVKNRPVGDDRPQTNTGY